MVSDSCVESLKNEFKKHETFEYEWRVTHLNALHKTLVDNLENYNEAVMKDLGRNEGDAYLEFMVVKMNIEYTLKHLKTWMADKTIDAPVVSAPSKNRIHYDPLGVVCVLGAWNFPIFTTLNPVVSAIAAGNCCMIKPSESSAASSASIFKMVKEGMDQRYFRAIEGGPEVGMKLTSMQWDLIAFTGGSEIGKHVAKAAASNLVPCVLELGGKNPTIIDESANIDYAAGKIVNGRYTNCGQICLAPDWCIVHESKVDEFLDRCQHYIRTMF